MNSFSPRAFGRVFPALACGMLLAGCQSSTPLIAANTSTLLGRIDAATGANTVVVATDARGRVVSRAFLANDPAYSLAVPSGRLNLYAFVDEDHDGLLGANEPASARFVLASPVARHERIELPPLQIRRERNALAAR